MGNKTSKRKNINSAPNSFPPSQPPSSPKSNPQIAISTAHSPPPPSSPKSPPKSSPSPNPSSPKGGPSPIMSQSPPNSNTLAAPPPRRDDTSVKENPQIGQWLKNIPLLAKLTDQERSQLGGYLSAKTFNDKETIVRQGDDGEGFFIIARGEVIVTKINEGETLPQELGRLKEGDFFGEAAIVSNTKRGATVSANGAVTTFYLARSHFEKLFSQDRLAIQFAKRAAISAETPLQAMKYTPKIPANAVKEKSANTIALINQAMKDNVLFMNLDSEHKAQIIAEMYRSEVKEGTAVIKQGDLGDNLYVVEHGTFHIYVNNKQVASRGAGTCFGELALMYNSPRAATVTAAANAVVWVVDRFTFRRIVTDLSDKKFALYVNFLKKVELLTPLAEYERRKIAEALEDYVAAPGQVIFQQGQPGDSMYIVYSGEVKIVQTQAGTNDQKEIHRCAAGDYFGERALLTNEPRAGSAIASTQFPQVQLLKLDRNAFHLLLGPIEEIMRSRAELYHKNEERKEEPFTFVNKVSKEELKELAVLGKGSFGFVKLVVDKKGTSYALKAVSKAQIVQTGQQGHVMSEKRAMATLDHPFLVKLHATYKDKNRLFFLLDPILGGELFTVLRERTLFDEETARFYAAQVVLAFEYMHDRGFVYRDLKPENLLLDKDGYLKVTDFGFAKDIGDGRTWTLCGTPDYLAPEIVAGKGHGKGVDWWTVGVFIYEMLASYPPFYDEDPMKTYAKIMQGNINFPSHFSKESISLIKKLLQHKPTKRLGVIQGGATAIKKHPWFSKFDWDALVHKRMKPPILPKIKSNVDTSNFEAYANVDQEHKVDEYQDDGSNWEADF